MIITPPLILPLIKGEIVGVILPLIKGEIVGVKISNQIATSENNRRWEKQKGEIKNMKWKEVAPEEYKKTFQRIFQNIKKLIEMIENDSKIGYEGFNLKQELREVVRSLTKIEEALIN